ncbi:MAG: Re/Si-specific NAD(P)(+) transhydrogenase subunit alpha [Gemmatimonadota bacterium]|jgi:NAD(P) transhydrogenase subunit alpha|nr:Re/Si-specific NAD(P)(+) transhydrogenase subunit alpha [Gemmatimonadota bacterium]
MRIGVPRETTSGERRVALMPSAVSRLVKLGTEVLVERGAGVSAFVPDALYTEAGARLVEGSAALAEADLVLKVQRPTGDEAAQLRQGGVLVSLLSPAASADLFDQLAARQVTAFSMELVPRTTKAQSMDVLSSQATVAGYEAVLLGAATMGRLLPMLTTAAGTIPPGKAFVIGAGVAGLQAIATARRLGAVVSAFDVRPVVKEQVQSLGASFVEVEQVAAEAAGGYAKELDQEQQRRVNEALAKHIADQDLVITTAQIPGRAAPQLISAEMVASMRPGSVIVDLASESGGNCALTRAGETVVAHGVSIIGPANLPSHIPFHASTMYSKNLQTFVEYILKEGQLQIDLNDPITGPMCVTHGGQVRYGR